ncbi:hypothetical protein EJ06DRAFT_542683 [Trichodelitschia bisporula]|uniref:Nop52-domain-containing protein n=1 Tax=Trichodelitschia bisporula TaxID=703511 RepID=A0A6G1HZL3_9PEZI|nr:hypothetical protein EJ06DRAFT_542683 [Trichodelitschia bisporula]
MTTTAANSSFLKQLGSSDKRKRDHAVDSLRNFLQHRNQLDELELLKLWKGLFYCMWMSDKPRNQQRLARDLAGLVDIVHHDTVLPFLDAFWKTMAREWNGIDVLRMDKFLYLVRVYLQASFRHFAKAGWKETSRIDEYMEILKTTPLNAKNARIPNGMRYHMLDIYVDELDRVDEDREGKLPLEMLLAPVKALAKDSPTKSVRERAKMAMEDERLKDWSNPGGAEEQANAAEQVEAGEPKEAIGGGEEWSGFDD